MLKHHDRVFADEGVSASTWSAGQTSNEARYVASNTKEWWRLDAPSKMPKLIYSN
jgi:hypothetical protein